MRARNPPLLPLLVREVRALFSTSSPWLLLVAALALVALQPNALVLLMTFVFPFIAARAFVKRHERPLLLQMGYRGASLVFARALALFCAFVPALALLAALGTQRATLVGASVLYGLVIMGVAAVARGRTLITWGVVVGTWWFAESARSRGDVLGVLARKMPDALLGHFHDGVVDVGAALSLLSLALGLLALAAALTPAPSERIARRAVGVLVATSLAFLASSSVRRYQDLTPERSASFPLTTQDALAKVKDPVRIEMQLDDRTARRLERALREVTVVRSDANTIDVGGRKRSARSADAMDVAKAILE